MKISDKSQTRSLSDRLRFEGGSPEIRPETLQPHRDKASPGERPGKGRGGQGRPRAAPHKAPGRGAGSRAWGRAGAHPGLSLELGVEAGALQALHDPRYGEGQPAVRVQHRAGGRPGALWPPHRRPWGRYQATQGAGRAAGVGAGWKMVPG